MSIIFKFVLCDDNIEHTAYLKKVIEDILKTNSLDGLVAYRSSNPIDIIEYSKKHKDENNVYILDIDLNDNISGINLAELIRQNEVTAYIIFISAYKEYSLLCYKTKTFDFLLKPLNMKDLENCIVNLFKDYKLVLESNNPTLSVKSGSKIYVININDIIYLEKFSNVAVFHTNKEIIQSYETLDSIQLKLQQYRFYRCHRSYIINLDYVNYISLDESIVYMKSGDKIYVSRNYKKGLIELVK